MLNTHSKEANIFGSFGGGGRFGSSTVGRVGRSGSSGIINCGRISNAGRLIFIFGTSGRIRLGSCGRSIGL
jgi:hypothetical protein